MTSIFCEVYGDSIRNRVMEYILENQDLDFAVGDIAKDLRISRSKAYDIFSVFESKGYVKKSRVIGRTQLYSIDRSNRSVRLLIKSFKECLKMASGYDGRTLKITEKVVHSSVCQMQ